MDIASFPASRILEIARAAFAGPPDVDMLCFGESDMPSPLSARDAVIDAIDAGATVYPDVRGIPRLRAALAAYLTALHRHPVPADRIQVTAGGMAAIAVALAAIVRAGDRVVLHTPAWPNCGNAARLRGAVVDELALQALSDGRFRLDLHLLETRLIGARAFILNTPNNPTGWTATRRDLEDILALCRRHRVWLIADEVYSRLVYDGRAAAPSLLDVAGPLDRVIVCNSFSKTWAMTGWRLGWMVVPEGAAAAITEIVEVTHSGVSHFAQHGALAAIADTGFAERFLAHCSRGRRLASEALSGLNRIRYAPPEAAFYAFVGIDGLTDSLSLALKLVQNHGVAVAPGIAFGETGEGYLRICFAQSAERLERAMDRLQRGLRAELGHA